MGQNNLWGGVWWPLKNARGGAINILVVGGGLFLEERVFPVR